jgi:uncharacterized membrane protein YozB (DUF420 family)
MMFFQSSIFNLALSFLDSRFIPTGPQVILTLKIAVGSVTLLLLASFVGLARGSYRVHGRINMVFFALTFTALIGLELVARLLNPNLFDYLDEDTRRWLAIHLCFSMPSAFIMPVMLWTGLTHRRRVHLSLAVIFGALWSGTVITGIFFLPHN